MVITSTAVTPFISTWKTDNTSYGSSTATQVKLPLISSGSYNFTVDWGDGTVHPDEGGGGFYSDSHVFPASESQYTVRVCFDDINSVTDLNLSND